MILTVCLSPSTDITVQLENLKVGKTNVVKSKKVSYAGKALGVAFGVKRLGEESYTTGFMYNENGYMYERTLDREGVPYTFIWNKGRVRENYKIIDSSGILTEINDIGEEVGKEKMSELLSVVSSLSERSEVVVVSGGLPKGVSAEYYGDILSVVSKKTLKIADCSGDRLLSSLNTGVDLIKPNLEELENTLKREMKDREDMLKGCYELIDKGTKNVLLSLGGEGAILTNGHESYYAKGIKTIINSTVGAGDAMLSAAAVMMKRNASLEDMLRAGVAAGTATVTRENGVSFAKEKYDEYYDVVQIEKI